MVGSLAIQSWRWLVTHGSLQFLQTEAGELVILLLALTQLQNGAMAKKPSQAEKKISKVMKEYKAGTLKSGQPGKGKGPVVKSRKQAIAIALSEAGKARKQKPKAK